MRNIYSVNFLNHENQEIMNVQKLKKTLLDKSLG
jgi:hypothetical protein